MKSNIIVYVSSHNNYDMLKGEVFNIDFEGFEFINVDDASGTEEVGKGKSFCKDRGVVFLENKGRGVQMATQTLIDFVNENRPNCKYILCFQHDVKPLSKNFFITLSELIQQGKLDEFGAVGFNVIDRGKYTGNALTEFNNGGKPLGMIGLAHLAVADKRKRWMSPSHNLHAISKNQDKWRKPFIIEFPAWMCIGINVDNWNESITPTEAYQFHLWFPDIAMQFNRANKPLLVLPDLYCLNEQEVKTKYGISANSAHGAKRGEEYHFGKYSNFIAWQDRWGWEYENAKKTFDRVKDRYEGTLLFEYFYHNIDQGPLKNYDI